jgi:hypothetical protein
VTVERELNEAEFFNLFIVNIQMEKEKRYYLESQMDEGGYG